MGAFLVTMGASSLCECAACCACSLLTTLIDFTMSQMRRISHLLLMIATFSAAVILGRYYPDKLNGSLSDFTKIDLSGQCDAAYLDECVYRQLIYRASLSLFLLFSALAAGSYFFDTVDRSFWPVKFLAALGVLAAFLWDDNAVFSQWAEVSRVLSLAWLLVQSLLVLDLAFGLHEVVMARAAAEEARSRGDSRFYLGLYLALGMGLLALSCVGLSYIFSDYAGCELGRFFAVTTVVIGIVSAAVSMLTVVNKGLLTPCACLAYSTFLCWYALLSSPDAECNPTAGTNGGPAKDASVALIAALSSAVLLICVCHGARILSIFNPRGQGLLEAGSQLEVDLVTGRGKQSSSSSSSSDGHADMGTIKATALPYTSVEDDGAGAGDEGGARPAAPASERVFFHVLMALASAYGGMILTSWGKTNGAPESAAVSGSSPGVASESMWFKIVAQWVFAALYLKALHAAYVDEQ